MTGTAETHMRRALTLAERALYAADPNPRVGCVLVDDDNVVVGEGWHVRAGEPHAEVVAIAAAGPAARGTTAYVTLEPCNHRGRTGPCSEALISAGVARVVCAMRDPNSAVAGGGAAALEAAGIPVAIGVLETDARRLNPGYLSRAERGRPFIRSKLAISLDGRTALANGASQWLTSEAARADVHLWRARSSAVLTGIGTVLGDDPSLDARPDDAAIDVLQPVRIVVDSSLRMPTTARTIALPGDVIVFTLSDEGPGADALRANGVRVERVGDVRGRCDLAAVARTLGELEINEVWVEAGAALNGALLEAGLIDELVVYLAPIVLGEGARRMFDLGELDALAQAPRFTVTDRSVFGPDLRIVAVPDSVPYG
jgi:diaminohydroxyphosphoribosylaminopyrimidine deaminase/5-amino-6-(5-phosphoribosylamino)uracil reductase